MKPPSDWPSKRSSTALAFTLERLPCAASTWKAAPASERIVPTRNPPSSSKSTCFMDPPRGDGRGLARPRHDVGHELREAREGMVPALHHRVEGPRIEGDGLAVVEHLVGRLHDEPVALRAGDRGRVERLELGDVLRREVEALAGVQVLLRAEVSARSAGGDGRPGSGPRRGTRSSRPPRWRRSRPGSCHDDERGRVLPAAQLRDLRIACAGRWCRAGTRYSTSGAWLRR